MKNLFHQAKAHLSALSTGFGLTLVVLYISFEFYSTPPGQIADSFWLTEIERMHKKSVDFRMRVRGTRLPETPVAIVGIDERAILAQGRFPWSRNKIATLVRELYKYDARVVATDIIFSEKENEELQEIINAIPEPEAGTEYQKELRSYKNEKLKLANADQNFAAAIKENSDSFVLSAFYDHLEINYKPFQRLCYNRVYEQTNYYEAWDNEAPHIGYSLRMENLDEEMPEAFNELTESLEIYLDRISQRISLKAQLNFCKEKFSYRESSFGTLNRCLVQLTPKEKEELKRASELAQREYCASWLDPVEDPYFPELQRLWPQFREKEEIYADLEFNDFLKGLKEKGGFITPFFPADFWSTAIPALDEATNYTGFLNAHPDFDGTVRTSPLVVQSGDQILPSLSFRALMVALGSENVQVDLAKSSTNESELNVGKVTVLSDDTVLREIPTDDQARFYINYAGPGYTFPHISAKELFEIDNPNLSVHRRVKDPKTGAVIEKKNDVVKKADFLKDKIIFIGGTAIGVYDLRVTPFDENFRGVETHANIVDNILRKDYLSTSEAEPWYMSIALLLIGIATTLVVSFLGAFPAALFSTTLFAGIYFLDRFLLFEKGTIVTLIFPLSAVGLIYAGLTILRYFTEEKNKKQLKGTFGKYVSPAIVEEILAHPDNIELGGRKERVTVFFSDVRGFTTISEALDAAQLSDLLNEYLTPMTDIIFENKGTLDKYIGDAIMAFFGAPLKHPDHAKQACRAALQNIEKLKELQVGFKERNLPHIDIGIGLNTGEVNVGNMGSNSVRNYTVMGDSVNLGARLEGITKQYGVRTIISEFTKEDIGDSFYTREVDWVRVKGKNKPVKIFELMAEDKASDQMKYLIDHFDSGFKKYHEMKWADAIKSFEQGLEKSPNDSVCKLYIDRCQKYIVESPPEGWDGVFVMKTK